MSDRVLLRVAGAASKTSSTPSMTRWLITPCKHLIQTRLALVEGNTHRSRRFAYINPTRRGETAAYETLPVCRRISKLFFITPHKIY
ncbi:hypothetical protein ACNKHU_13625 [Shigella flexneri]